MRTVGAVLSELEGSRDPFEGWLDPWRADWVAAGSRLPAEWLLVAPELAGLDRCRLADPRTVVGPVVADSWLRGLLRVSDVLADDDAVMVVLGRLVPALKLVMVKVMENCPDFLDMEDVPGVVVSTAWDEIRKYRSKGGEPSRIAANVLMNTRYRCRWDYSRTSRFSSVQITPVDDETLLVLGSRRAGSGRSFGRSLDQSVEGEAGQTEALDWLWSEVEAVVVAGGHRWSIGVETAFYLAAGAWVYGMRAAELAEVTGLGSSQAVRDRLAVLRRGIRRRNPGAGIPSALAA